MDERTFLVALIIQKPQNGITCFTQVCTSYCRFDCIMCVWHTHTNSETPMPHIRHPHTHTHSCMQWNVLFYVVASSWPAVQVCVCVCEYECKLPPGKHCMSKQANIRLCSNAICRAYIKCMRHIGSTEKFQDIRYKPTCPTVRVCGCSCVFVCACGCSSRWSHIIGRHPYANCIPYISGIPFLNRATRKNER